MDVKAGSLHGSHVLAEFYGVDDQKLDDEAFLRNSLEKVLHEAGASVLKVVSSRFSPQGVTVLALLAESHASIHTYPEVGAAFIDFFTCGEKADSQRALDLLAKELGTERVFSRRVRRGPLLPQKTNSEEK